MKRVISLVMVMVMLLSFGSGAIAIGYMVDDYLNLLRYIDYREFRNAVQNTREGYFVQIMVGYTADWIPIRLYNAWNSNFAEGIPSERGKWTKNINLK